MGNMYGWRDLLTRSGVDHGQPQDRNMLAVGRDHTGLRVLVLDQRTGLAGQLRDPLPRGSLEGIRRTLSIIHKIGISCTLPAFLKHLTPCPRTGGVHQRTLLSGLYPAEKCVWHYAEPNEEFDSFGFY